MPSREGPSYFGQGGSSSFGQFVEREGAEARGGKGQNVLHEGFG